MSKPRLLTTLKWIDEDNPDGALYAKLYRNGEWDEYVVDYYEDGKKVSDSFHEDKRDALGDAHANLEFMAKRRLKRRR